MIEQKQTNKRQIRQLKYITRQLRKQSPLLTSHSSLLEHFRRLFRQQHLLPLSYKFRQTVLALAVSLGLQQAQAQNPIGFATPVPDAYNLLEIVPAGLHRAYSGDFVDIDNDGDLDLFYGKYGAHIVNNNFGYGNVINFQLNVGTPVVPSFATPVSNPYGINNNSFVMGHFAAPHFADIDNDGDFDLFVTHHSVFLYNGRQHGVSYFENTGTATTPNFAAPIVYPFGIDSSLLALTQINLVDMDNDGDLDLFYGETYNTYNRYNNTVIEFQENIGTPTTPVFGPKQINTFLPPNPLPNNTGTSNIDFADLDGDGDQDLQLIYSDGFYNTMVTFDNVGSASNPSFGTRSSSFYNNILHPNKEHNDVIFADLDNDGDQDFVVFRTENNPPFSVYEKMVYHENTTIDVPDPRIGFDSTSLTVNEAAGTIDIGIQLNIPSSYPTTVEVEVLTASTSTDTMDFLIASSLVTIPPNDTSALLSIALVDDIVVEGTEHLFLSLKNPIGALLGSNDTLQLIITDNDTGTPIINFDQTVYQVSEEVGTVTIPISITHPSSNATTLELSLDNNSTANNTDHGLTLPMMLTFAPNATAPIQLHVPITNDRAFETTESLILRLSNVTNNGNVGNIATATIQITDNDPHPTVHSSIVSAPSGPLLPPSSNTTTMSTLPRREVAIYPNPFQQSFTLEVTHPMGQSLRLVNPMGQVLIEQPLSNPKTKLSVAELPTGLYWLHIYDSQTGATYWQKQILKQ